MSQLTKGKDKRVMYVENKEGEIDGVRARIGWVTFSKTGQSIYYRNLVLKRIKGGGVSGNFYEEQTGQEFWVSGIKKFGSNAHWAEPVDIYIDDDALDEYRSIKEGRSK